MYFKVGFLQVQFRLRQIIQTDPSDRDELLQELEKFAFTGCQDLPSYEDVHESVSLTIVLVVALTSMWFYSEIFRYLRNAVRCGKVLTAFGIYGGRLSILNNYFRARVSFGNHAILPRAHDR